MDLQRFADAFLLLFVLLNPFLMSIYLLDLIEQLDSRTFRHALIRGSLISFCAFTMFAWAGDSLFSTVLQVRFASFLIFGGIVFLIIGVRFVLVGSDSLRDLRGDPEHLSGSIAMPFMIGPGTVSASVLAGSQLPVMASALAIFSALVLTVVTVILFKWIHDKVRRTNERLIERYIDVMGRISALVIGTIAADMILRGVELWLGELPGALATQT